MLKAEMIADSVDRSGRHRMRTFKLRYPWFIHGEVMTHRMLSKNASSNRAIPIAKMLQEVRSDDLRAEPFFWGAEQKGMSPGGELKGRALADAKLNWKSAALQAANAAENLAACGAHKSLCNRVLMPFTHANVVLSGTEFDNFFGLRLREEVDPTMRELARLMWRAQALSEPRILSPGEWHLPFVDNGVGRIEDLIKVSVARCARVSYESFETKKESSYEEDVRLYEKLVGAQPLHASPAEHQATPDEFEDNATSAMWGWHHPKEHGNLVGWRQYRKMLLGEAVAPLPEEYRHG